MNTVREIKNLPYADYDGRKLLLDLFIPDAPGAARPVILWVRGGGWREVDKNVPNPGAAMAAQGFVAAVIEYRSSSEAIAPANLHDCKAAVRWLRAQAGVYGLDHDRIGAAGGSAGGHLVALLGTTAGSPDLEGRGGNPAMSSAVQAVCDFCGPSDLTRMAQPALQKQFAPLYACTADYLGGPVDQRLELARTLSPLHRVTPAAAPTLIIHGDADDIVSVEESILFHAALVQNGVDATLHVGRGATHDLSWTTYGDQVMSFFRRTLKLC
ncbi:MAG: alpha/beta hydrolase [bacterium]